MTSSRGVTFVVAGTSWTTCQRVLRSGQYSRHPLVLWRSCATGREVHSGPYSGFQGALRSTMVTVWPWV